jgi:hypothetical protein
MKALVCATLILLGTVLAPVAHADAVTASECKHGNGVVHIRPHFPYICVGGRWDGAEVWSSP